jgi:hypothetical protein
MFLLGLGNCALLSRGLGGVFFTPALSASLTEFEMFPSALNMLHVMRRRSNKLKLPNREHVESSGAEELRHSILSHLSGILIEKSKHPHMLRSSRIHNGARLNPINERDFNCSMFVKRHDLYSICDDHRLYINSFRSL